MSGRRRKLSRTAVRLTMLVILLPLTLVGVRWGGGNQGTIIPGRVYRSGQLTGSGIANAIDRHGIRTVLNLRGANPDQAWYRAERSATIASGATLVDLALASDLWLTREQARMLVEILDACEYPVLIHCQWGAERTGLAAAIVELLRPGGTIASARGQFSPYYLYLPIKDGLVMRAHVDRYEAWLESVGLEHSPDQFRRWLTTVYEPGSPSREEWPYDPYPLAVITRPAGAASGHASATLESMSVLDAPPEPRKTAASRRR